MAICVAVVDNGQACIMSLPDRLNATACFVCILSRTQSKHGSMSPPCGSNGWPLFWLLYSRSHLPYLWTHWRQDECWLWVPLLCFPAETERGQRLPDVDVAQQLKLRERQRFFEEVFQHDVDVYLSSAHLCIRDYKRRELWRWHFCDCTHMQNSHISHVLLAPIGSISSMEVNVDLLDQMELIDISEQDALDVFFSSGEEGVLTSPLPGTKPASAVHHRGDNSNKTAAVTISFTWQEKETTTTRKWLATDSFDTSWTTSKPSPARPPHLPTPPSTAKQPVPTEATPLWSDQMTTKHILAPSGGERHLQRERSRQVRLHLISSRSVEPKTDASPLWLSSTVSRLLSFSL